MDQSFWEERSELQKLVKNVNPSSFDRVADRVFDFQVRHNQVFSNYLAQVGQTKWDNLATFLPISAFKHHAVCTGQEGFIGFFESSATSGQGLSQSHFRDLNWYHDISRKLFEAQFGDISDTCILALLPHYLERSHSSLVSMVQAFIGMSKDQHSGFYLYDHQKLYETILEKERDGVPTILFGVSFALLDFAESYRIEASRLTIIETGGMKGRGVELTKEELHTRLQAAFPSSIIGSEYGMTELTSQAYSLQGQEFEVPSTMRIYISELSDPFSHEQIGKAGVLHIVDLANIDTCAWIRTEDVGMMLPNGRFKVLGRLDHSEARGCSLMVV